MKVIVDYFKDENSILDQVYKIVAPLCLKLDDVSQS